MAMREDETRKINLTASCSFDTGSGILSDHMTGKSKKLGRRLARLLTMLLNSPGRHLSLTMLAVELDVDEESVNRYMRRVKNAVEEVTGTEDADFLFRRENNRWSFRIPEEVLKTEPILTAPSHFFLEKKYLPENLPRLMERLERRVETENMVINHLLMKEESVIFITGEAGIGKSEFVINVGRRLSKAYKVARIVYEDSLYDTIMELYPDIQGGSERSIFEKKLAALMNAYEEGFLIIDGFFDPARTFNEMRQDEVFRRLLGSKIRLIFVTRYQDEGNYSFIRLETLPREGQIRVMRNGGLEKYSDSQLGELCDLCGGNTLLCELVGKLLANPFDPFSIDGIKKLLEESRLSRSKLEVSSEKDRDYSEATAYAHLKSLCEGMTLTYTEKKILKEVSLLPGDGMRVKDFYAFAGIEENALTALSRKGLVKINGDDRIVLHALYALYYRDMETEDTHGVDISSFLDNIFEHYNSGDISDSRLNGILTSVLHNAWLSEPAGGMKARIGLFYSSFLALSGRYSVAARIEKVSIGYAGEERDILVRLYKDYGISLGRLEDNSGSVEYLEKAWDMISDCVHDTVWLQTANSLAYAYGKNGDHEKQRELLEDILKADNGHVNIRSRARMENNLADALYRLGDMSEAKEHILRALEIYRSLENAPAIWIIQAERLLALITYGMDEREDAVKMIEDDIDAAKESLASDHLELIRLYGALGDMLEGSEAGDAYAEALRRSENNEMARERLHTFMMDGKQYRCYSSEGGSLFCIEASAESEKEENEFDLSTFKRIIIG